MNKLDKTYQDLLQDILDNGVIKGDRTGTGTISVFGRQIRHKMSDGFPLLTTKKIHWNSVVSELLWFIAGSTDIRHLWNSNCKIWDGDWYKKYKASCSSPYTLKEIKEKIKTKDHQFHDSMFDLGPIYGAQWRGWGGFTKFNALEKLTKHPNAELMGIDQIQDLMDGLGNNPDSRRLMVNAWNVAEIDKMTLPPCHYGFQVWTRELSYSVRLRLLEKKYDKLGKSRLGLNHDRIEQQIDKEGIPKREISLMWNQRSVDTFLGLPFNIASYGLLLEMLAQEMNMVAGDLIGNLGDTHLYSNHIEQAKEQISRTSFDLPTVQLEDGMYCHSSDIHLENYKSHGVIKAPLSN